MDFPTHTTKQKVMAPVGARAKRTIKAAALGQEVSKRALKAVKHGRTDRYGQVIVGGFKIGRRGEKTSGSVSLVGGTAKVSVHKPKPFFYLTDTQLEEVQLAFRQYVGKKISEALKLVA